MYHDPGISFILDVYCGIPFSQLKIACVATLSVSSAACLKLLLKDDNQLILIVFEEIYFSQSMEQFFVPITGI